jgi:DNA-binding transcriptional MerR regulator
MKDKPNSEIAELLQRMSDSSLSVNQLAKELGVSTRTIRRWQKGDGPIPEPRHLERLKELFSPDRQSEKILLERNFTQEDVDLLQRMLLALRPFSLAYAFDLVKKRNT